MKTAFSIAFILALFLTPASAHTHHRSRAAHAGHYATSTEKPFLTDWYNGPALMPRYTSAPFDDNHVVGFQKPFTEAVHAVTRAIAEVVAHPAGCPHTAFCGCGAAAYLGLHDRSLWLAANWLRFPRAQPAPGMAAVRQHHVFVIVQYEGGDRAIAYDANSGHHMTRVHEVSLSGYRIVNPRGV